MFTKRCLFVSSVQKRSLKLLARILKYENSSGNMFAISMSLNMFFFVFSVILTQKCSNLTYVLGSKTVSTATARYFFVYMWKNRNILFHGIFSTSQTKSYRFSCFESSKYIKRLFFVGCFLLNRLFLLIFSAEIVIASAAPIFLHFHHKKHHSSFCFLAS